MMKAEFLSFILLFVFGSVMPTGTQTAQRIKLGIKKQKAVTDGMTMKFVAVIEDSRCPVGVDCVWEGNAKVQIKISNRKGNSQTFELSTHPEPQAVTFEGYEIRLGEVTPRPRAGVSIDPKSYAANFTVTKL
jgi:hypothetical protein